MRRLKSANRFFTQAKAPPDGRGFTLVELLVVIGIIAALIAMLLPTLIGARRAAMQVQCAAQIQQVLELVQNHATTHLGYVPMAGMLNVPSINPSGLNDPTQSKYDYLSIGGVATNTPLCFTASFASDLGDLRILNAQTVDDLNTAQMDPRGFLRIFRCPSHLPEPGPLWGPLLYLAVPPADGSGNIAWQSWNESQSYIYNEAALGWDDTLGRNRGQVSRVRLHSQTMIMADGLGGSASRVTGLNLPSGGEILNMAMSTVYNKVPNGPVTLADALAGNANAGDPQNFDTVRHHGRMNIGYFDGHVESRNISANDL